MKDDKKWAIICWVGSALILLATLLSYGDIPTKKTVFDLVIALIWAFAGFWHWKRNKKEEE